MEIWKRNLYIIIVCQVIALTSFGFAIPFLSYYIKELGVSNKESLDLYTGLATFIPALSTTMMAPIWGKLSDIYGKKKMLQRAMFFSIFTIAGLSIVQNPEQLIILRFFQGMLTGTIAASASFVGSYTPKEHISFAIGALATSNSIGFAIGPAIGGIVADITSYRTSFLVGASIALAGYIIISRFLNEDMSSYEKKFNFSFLKNKKNIKNLFARHPKLNIEKLDIGDKIFMLMLSTVRFTRMMFVPSLPLYVAILSGSKENMASTIGIINMITGASAALAGFTIAKIGDKYNKIFLSRIIMLLAFIFSAFTYRTNTLYSFLIFYIFMSFMLTSLEPLFVSSSVEKTKIIKKGAFFGLQSMSQNFGSMIAPLFGSFIAIYFGYKKIILSMSISIVILFILNISTMKNDN